MSNTYRAQAAARSTCRLEDGHLGGTLALMIDPLNHPSGKVPSWTRRQAVVDLGGHELVRIQRGDLQLLALIL